MSGEEWEILRLSLLVAGCATAALLPIGIGLGWLLARGRFPGKTLLDVIVHLPLVLPPVVTGWLLLLALGRRSAIGSWLHEWFGIQVSFTWIGAVVAAAAMALPLLVRPVRLAIELTDRGLEDAARTLGASPWRARLTVTLPLAAPGILAGAALAFARCLGEFGATITLAGNIPGESRTLPVAIWSLTQVPDGDERAWRLVAIAIAVSFASLLISEVIARHWAKRRGMQP